MHPTKTTMIGEILELAKSKATAAEVYWLWDCDTPVEFENNRLKSLQTKTAQGIALRVVCNGRLGFASSTDLTRIDELVAAAVQTAEIGAPTEEGFTANVQITVPKSHFNPPKSEELVAVGERLIEQVRQYRSEILVDASFHVRSRQVKLATTSNTNVERTSQTVSARLSGNLVQGEDFLQADSSEVTRDSQPNYSRILQQLLQKYQQAEHQAAIASGSCPVLFTPRAVAKIIGRLFRTILSGQSVVQKASPLIERLGEQLFDPRLTIFEDPTIGSAACSFDDEGTLTYRKSLIEQGVVKQFYWDRHWAVRAGGQSTGNGFRGGISRPLPSLVNFCMAPGKTPKAQLIAGMETGLIVDQVLGAGQSNQLAGEFSVNLDLGYKVEQGKIVGRVKNTMVAGSIFEAFTRLGDLSAELEWVDGSTYVPWILFEQLSVASRE